MKNTIKASLIALAIAGVATAAQAASYPSGDLIIGFTISSGNDYMFDLGQVSSLTSGEVFHLGTGLNTANAGLISSSTKWGVVGNDEVNGFAYSTKAVGLPPAVNEGLWGAQDTAVNSIYSIFASGGPGASSAPGSSLDNSWNHQTVAPTLVTQYRNAYDNPNQTGFASLNLYSMFLDESAPSLLGTFSFANNGDVTFSAVAVPEPTTYGLFAAAGVLALSLRKQFRSKQA